MLDEALLSRIEDASLNASAPTQQLWMDGWLLRFSPGKAKRARCINAVAAGRLPLDEKLRLATDAFRAAGLPMMLRITRFSLPADLDAQLAARGFTALDDTRVMVCPALPVAEPAPLPPGTHWVQLDAVSFAEAIGALRNSPVEQRRAQAERLSHAPVPFQAFAIRRDGDDQVLACGQFAREAELLGLYDIFTRDSARGRGLARRLCERLLALAAKEGARVGYLQVEHGNDGACRLYQRLGFAEACRYHYRVAPD